VNFTFKKMKEEDAQQIASWHYEAPYDFYDMDQDPGDLAELLDPQSWQECYYSVFNGENKLVGFFVFKQDDQTVEIGLGLRPELTGKGFGLAFLNAGLLFAQGQFAARKWSLNVATFNKRAIRLYERAGFTPLNIFMHQTNGGEYEFLHMVRLV
jgi:[ribosomal protein S18]-alanine N-acetyltransferase